MVKNADYGRTKLLAYASYAFTEVAESTNHSIISMAEYTDEWASKGMKNISEYQ